jgi:hypothetical protein
MPGRAPRLVENGTFPLDRPLAAQSPLVDAQVLGQFVGATFAERGTGP